mmetsp:Transcript_4893/g.6488  ORF Transcript_4893/g.6488 Transcript_4893/m.6488 type:complete len:82 (+) Transcript_4893:989-1234(+)
MARQGYARIHVWDKISMTKALIRNSRERFNQFCMISHSKYVLKLYKEASTNVSFFGWKLHNHQSSFPNSWLPFECRRQCDV